MGAEGGLTGKKNWQGRNNYLKLVGATQCKIPTGKLANN